MALITSRWPALWMAGMGVISGIVSDLSLSLRVPHPLGQLDAPIYPGLIFGLVIALGIFLFGRTRIWGALIAFFVTVVAWIAAFKGCVVIYDGLALEPAIDYARLPLESDGSVDRESALRLKETARSNLFALVAAVIAGGAIGAGGTALGAAIAAPARRPDSWLLTTLVGAVSAIALFAVDSLIGAPPGYEFLALFVIWQAAVAASVGYNLGESRSY